MTSASRRDDRPIGNPPPDCQSCGVCCFSTLEEYIRVFGVDHERMADCALQHTHFIGNRCFMRMQDGRCVALTIDPDRHRFSCAIYEVRPDTCRSLVAGTGACLGEIHDKSDRPLIAITDLLRLDGS